MKIAFIGTHGTGKTTLCHLLVGELKKRHKNAEMVTEIARKCPLPINQDTNREAQLWILASQIAEELETGNNHDYVICDRSVLDNYAYSFYNSGSDGMMESMVDSWIDTYDVLFKVPNCYALEDDGVRATEVQFQEDIDRVVDDLLETKGIEYVPLPEEDQMEFVLEYLGFS